jgi:hypothetical protein
MSDSTCSRQSRFRGAAITKHKTYRYSSSVRQVFRPLIVPRASGVR